MVLRKRSRSDISPHRPVVSRVQFGLIRLGVLLLLGITGMFVYGIVPPRFPVASTHIEPGQRETQDKGFVRIAIGAEPVTLDPHDASDAPSSFVIYHLYDRLVEIDDAMNPVPSLAERWERIGDGSRWRFYLRQGVHFHDGTLLDAQAVAHNFNRLIDPANTLARRSLLGDYLEQVDALDRYTVEFRLRRPFGSFLRLLAHEAHGVISPHVLAALERGERFVPVGTGPFVLAGWDVGSRLTLRTFDAYWGDSPRVEGITLLIVPEGSSRAMMLEAGSVDVVYPLEPIFASWLRRRKGVAVMEVPSQRMIYAAVNLNRPSLHDMRVRQAMSLAIDRDGIVENLLFGLGRAADSPLAPATWGYVPTGPFRFDPHQAQELVSVVFGEESLPVLDLWSPVGRYPQDKAVAQAVAAFLTEIGFPVRLQLFEWGTYLGMLRTSNDWDLALLGWVPSTGDADMALRPLFMSGARGNHSGYASKDLDALLEEGAFLEDSSRREDVYRRAQEVLARELPVIWLYTVDVALAYRTTLAGLRVRSTEIVDLRALYRVEGGS